MTSAVRVQVPATSANLGPGFDCFGLALGIHDEVLARVAGSGVRVRVTGEGAGEVPGDERNLVASAMLATFARMGESPPGLEVECTNRIPHSRGLGSSAAAIVAGVLAARALAGGDRLDAAAVLRLCSEIEGHPDNVAACLRGGFTLAWTSSGSPECLRLEPAAGVVPVVLVPAVTASTAAVRRLLPPSVPHPDAAANSARAALLVAALTGHPDLLLEATEDRLHQAYRAPAMPGTAALVQTLRAAGVPAVVSGAGPTVLALTDAGSAAEVAARGDAAWCARVLEVDLAGAEVTNLTP